MTVSTEGSAAVRPVPPSGPAAHAPGAPESAGPAPRRALRSRAGLLLLEAAVAFAAALALLLLARGFKLNP